MLSQLFINRVLEMRICLPLTNIRRCLMRRNGRPEASSLCEWSRNGSWAAWGVAKRALTSSWKLLRDCSSWKTHRKNSPARLSLIFPPKHASVLFGKEDFSRRPKFASGERRMIQIRFWLLVSRRFVFVLLRKFWISNSSGWVLKNLNWKNMCDAFFVLVVVCASFSKRLNLPPTPSGARTPSVLMNSIVAGLTKSARRNFVVGVNAENRAGMAFVSRWRA